MVDLESTVLKNVILVSESKVYKGTVIDYCYPEDNEIDEDSIIVDVPGRGKGTGLIMFYRHEIDRLEVE